MTFPTIQTNRVPRDYARTIPAAPRPERRFRRVIQVFLALHIVGAFYCFPEFTNQAPLYIAGNLLFICSYAILYSASSNPGFRAVHAVVMVITVAYALTYSLKVFLIVSLPEELIEVYGPLVQSALRSEAALVSALWIGALFGVSISIGVWLFTSFSPSSSRIDQAFQPVLPSDSGKDLKEVYSWTVVFAAGLSIISIGLMAYFEIGVKGQVTMERLPYRLGGIVYYSHTLLLPCLITHIMLMGARLKRLGGGTLAGLFLMSALGFSDTVLTTSRGALLYYLTFWFLAVWTGRTMYGLRIQHSAKVLCVALAFATVAATPYLSSYRNIRKGNSMDAITGSLSIANTSIRDADTGPVWNMISGVSHMMMRLTGIEMLAVYEYADVTPSAEVYAAIVSAGSVGDYVTHAVFQLPLNIPNAIAPSIVGSFYLVGGLTLVVVGGLVVGGLPCMLWMVLSRRSWGSAGYAHVMLLTSIIYYMTEGILENVLFAAAVCASVTLVSLLPGARPPHWRTRSRQEFRIV